MLVSEKKKATFLIIQWNKENKKRYSLRTPLLMPQILVTLAISAFYWYKGSVLLLLLLITFS